MRFMKKALAFASVSLALGIAACGPDKPAEAPRENVIQVPEMPIANTTSNGPDPAEIERARQKAEMDRAAEEKLRLAEAAKNAPAGDPAHDAFTLEDATAGLIGAGPLVATIKTTMGDMTCKLLADRAPVTVANFVGLARGLRPFRTSKSGAWEKRPVYDGTVFHRVIKGFMIQGGDPLGNGTGEGGYVFPDEIWAGAKHDRAGLLCMANRGPNTNGIQFFITDAAAAHLDKGYTIFGECSPVSVVHAIANVPVNGSRPVTDVAISTIEITRGAAPAAPAAKPKGQGRSDPGF
jgi:peptidyl-prolyl cis-trans isomerase A (cyclophilin A)